MRQVDKQRNGLIAYDRAGLANVIFLIGRRQRSAVRRVYSCASLCGGDSIIVMTFLIMLGWFNKTLGELVEAAQDRSIALLRLDCDWYDSPRSCQEHVVTLIQTE